MVATVTGGGGGGAKRRGRKRARRAAAMSEINITPFVDVMLVLLIIFMVAAPLLTVGVPVDLPEAENDSLPQPQEEPLTLTLTADGRVFIMETETPEADLPARLRAILAERSDDDVYLRADGSLSYERVMQFMGALNRSGFSSVNLITNTGGPSFGDAPASEESDG